MVFQIFIRFPPDIEWAYSETDLAQNSVQYVLVEKKQARKLTQLTYIGGHHRGRTFIESDRMTSSAPMESADQTARAGGHVSTTMVLLARPPTHAV